MSNSVTKDDAREVIDSVIIENGERGITAHSLASVLHTMVDAAGESSNTGGGEEILKVKVVEEGELTETDKEANALVYQKILNCLRNENIPFVYLMSFIKVEEEEGALLGMMSYLIPVQTCIYAEEAYGTNIVLQYMISGNSMGTAMLQEDGLVQMLS